MFIIPFTSPEATLEKTGGKGANLARLTRAGFDVPRGFIVSTDAYREFVTGNALAERIRASIMGLIAEDVGALKLVDIDQELDQLDLPKEIENSNTVLSFPVTTQFFKTICGRNSQVIDVDAIIGHTQFPQGHLLNIRRQFARAFTLIDFLCLAVFEGFDHSLIIVRRTKRQALYYPNERMAPIQGRHLHETCAKKVHRMCESMFSFIGKHTLHRWGWF